MIRNVGVSFRFNPSFNVILSSLIMSYKCVPGRERKNPSIQSDPSSCVEV